MKWCLLLLLLQFDAVFWFSFVSFLFLKKKAYFFRFSGVEMVGSELVVRETVHFAPGDRLRRDRHGRSLIGTALLGPDYPLWKCSREPRNLWILEASALVPVTDRPRLSSDFSSKDKV